MRTGSETVPAAIGILKTSPGKEVMAKQMIQRYGGTGAGGIHAGTRPATPTLHDALSEYMNAIADGGPGSDGFLAEVADCVLSRMTKRGLEYKTRDVMMVIDAYNAMYNWHETAKTRRMKLATFFDAAGRYASVDGEKWADDPKFAGSC